MPNKETIEFLNKNCIGKTFEKVLSDIELLKNHQNIVDKYDFKPSLPIVAKFFPLFALEELKIILSNLMFLKVDIDEYGIIKKIHNSLSPEIEQRIKKLEKK